MRDDVDPVDVVSRGYDVLSHRYRDDDASEGQYGPWIAELIRRVAPNGRVLDVGCGCGVPVARELAGAGCRVLGIDVSEVQVERARRLVPDAQFVCGDVTRLKLPEASFDAVVAPYSIIHVPLSAQPALLRGLADYLVDGGVLLLTAGERAWTGSDPDWLGGGAQMWWSHADAATYHDWLRDADLQVVDQHYVAEGDSGHSLFWAIRKDRSR